MKTKKIFWASLLLLLFAGGFQATTNHRVPSHAVLASALPGDPLGELQGSGVPVGISWTGDGERISNPSFETGSLFPWITLQNNAASGTGASVATRDYVGTKSANLTIFSGNLSSPSYLTLLSDFSPQPVGFSVGLRFRAAALVQQLTGATLADRVEADINLTTSTGNIREIHYVFAYGTLPHNSTTDAYFKIGAGPSGQWLTIDRSMAADASAAFPSDYTSFDSVSQVTLTVYSQTIPGAQNVDSHLRFWDLVGTGKWQSGEPVIYDTDNNGAYDTGEPGVGGCTDATGNPVVCSSLPPNGTPLASDPNIKFVDLNGNGVWDPGEPIVYDSFNTSVVNYLDPIIIGPKPAVGTLLEKIVQHRTGSLFDRIELYSATSGSEWIKNGGFESGLTGWYQNSSFTSSTAIFLSGTHSARGSITNGASQMVQSIDGRPLIDSSTRLTASANIAAMTGTSAASMVDVWLGLVDSKYNPVSLYFVFRTGDGSVPANRTDAVYTKVNGFGTMNQWLSVNASLAQETTGFNLLGYTPPYSVEIVVVEITAKTVSSTTTVYFDNFSLHSSGHSSILASTFYAIDGLNTVFAYTSLTIPSGSFHLEIPPGETVLNITSPEGSALQPSEYLTSFLSGCTVSPCLVTSRAVDVPYTTMLNHLPVGNWRVFATSANAVASVYAEDPSTHGSTSNIGVGSTVNLVSQYKDPSGKPLSGAAVNVTLWNTSSGLQSGFWAGSTNSLGWFNVSSVTLPLSGSSPGFYSLQASVYSVYPGVRTFQMAVRYTVALSVAISSSQVSQGESVTISGTVTPTGSSSQASGVNVTVYYRQAGSSQWTALVIVKTGSSGNFVYTWNPPQGQYEVKASTGDSQTGSADSNRVQVVVGAPAFPWLLVLVGVGVALAALITFLLFDRRRKMRRSTA